MEQRGFWAVTCVGKKLTSMKLWSYNLKSLAHCLTTSTKGLPFLVLHLQKTICPWKSDRLKYTKQLKELDDVKWCYSVSMEQVALLLRFEGPKDWSRLCQFYVFSLRLFAMNDVPNSDYNVHLTSCISASFIIILHITGCFQVQVRCWGIDQHGWFWVIFNSYTTVVTEIFRSTGRLCDLRCLWCHRQKHADCGADGASCETRGFLVHERPGLGMRLKRNGLNDVWMMFDCFHWYHLIPFLFHCFWLVWMSFEWGNDFLNDSFVGSQGVHLHSLLWGYIKNSKRWREPNLLFWLSDHSRIENILKQIMDKSSSGMMVL